MIARKMMAIMLIVAVPLSCGACSFVAVKGPPPNHGSLNYFTCTEGNTWPVLDTIWAGLNGLGAVNALSSTEEELPNRGQVIGVGLSWLVISGAAAIYGFGKTSKCRAATAEKADRQYGRPVTPPSR